MDLSPSHNPIIASFETQIIQTSATLFLANKQTNWAKFQEHYERNINCK